MGTGVSAGERFVPQGRFLYVVKSQFAGSAGQEREWNTWYDDADVPEMLALDGILSATRYKARSPGSGYATMYEIASLEIFDTPAYKKMAGWRNWAPYIAESRRLVYELACDLGPVL